MCLKLQKLKEDHVLQGHYLEYLKFACEPTCQSCEKVGWTAGVPANWFPVPDLSDTAALHAGIHVPSNVTSMGDDTDRQLPSVQVTKLVDSGMLTSSNAKEMHANPSQQDKLRSTLITTIFMYLEVKLRW